MRLLLGQKCSGHYHFLPIKIRLGPLSVSSPWDSLISANPVVCVFFFSLLVLTHVCLCVPVSSGADDLLPILSYVALRCDSPQLVSECAALEEFIHEG